jgi:hypothetical protein
MFDGESNLGDGSGGCQRRQADTPVLVTSLVGPCAMESIFFSARGPGESSLPAFPNLPRRGLEMMRVVMMFDEEMEMNLGDDGLLPSHREGGIMSWELGVGKWREKSSAGEGEGRLRAPATRERLAPTAPGPRKALNPSWNGGPQRKKRQRQQQQQQPPPAPAPPPAPRPPPPPPSLPPLPPAWLLA